MEQTWRWYGPNDPVSLDDVRQAGATGVVTALHHIANGEVWPIDEIRARQTLLAEKGLVWSVVESVPVHEEIKTHSGDWQRHIAHYQQTLRNLAVCGIDTVCYNFMPILDWTRTDLAYSLPDGAKALRFDQIAFAAFELHILQRAGAEVDYTPQERSQAAAYFAAMSEEEKATLTGNIIAGLPGAEEGYTLDQFRRRLAEYDGIDKAQLRENMAVFLRAIVPVAEEAGIRLAVHPDDPPRPILGLPRIVSTIEDMQWLKQTVDSIHNGFTLCTGSYGVRADNDLVRMIETFGDRIHFTHLRATCREENPKSFHEGAHLQGDVDMVAVIEAILTEELRRQRAGDRRPIPMRPDHGHQMLDDLKKKTNPGYSAIGRLKGLAELRGVELALKRRFFPELP
ncbi:MULTISPECIES: mannonate dehydratase [Serratia]|uniref:Mannonate dehydratase n=2 Tax=Serratia marcescens TaxID=615 RepID=A0ABC9IKB9_SERMA|nr:MULTISPECIES: mannonate dehydratase [Serratia]QHI79106.1 mannonate dehydratase [Serratia sp. NGAS9]KFF80337.1 mannonate dehydratase [Serratia marcescens]KMU53835.1 mannonate dehydratase [Serratia marcescens]MBE5259016.1 mannonate dehydratase [Serratia marcescens]MBE5300478.1 mannonate dehydratase [Serratia marcescens]